MWFGGWGLGDVVGGLYVLLARPTFLYWYITSPHLMSFTPYFVVSGFTPYFVCSI